MSTEPGIKALLGQLVDEGFSTVLVNRVEELLGVYNDNIEQFTKATRGQLNAAYVKAHPETKLKGLGAKTFDVFDRFVAIWKQSKYDAKQIAKATVEEQERKKAERAEMRNELLDSIVDFDALTAAMAALGTLGLKSCGLGKLLEMHDLALRAQKGGEQQC